jgi:hypothetical protein
MEKQGNLVSVNPLARAGVISTGVVETTNPMLVANEAQQMRIKAALTPEEYTIFTEVGALTQKYPTKDEFYAALTPEQVRIFNKGMTAARKDGGRRRGKMLSAFYNKMTHTRKHRGGMDPIVPRKIALKTIYHTAAQVAKNKAWKKELAEEKAEKKRKFEHAMANPRRSARLAKKRGGRRTRRK